MIEHQLLRDERILIVVPSGPLEQKDFEGLAAVVDPFVAEGGALAGLLVYVESFPGWDDFAGLVAHMKFVKGHHEKIKRIALCTDSALVDFAPKIAKHFVAAEIKTFPYDDREAAMAWIAG